MRSRKEIWGLGCEFVGLVVVLFAVFWQAYLSGWWDAEIGEWQFLIQENVNLSLLYSTRDLALLAVEEDPNTRNAISRRVVELSVETASQAMRERDKRRSEIQHGQYSVFSCVRKVLLVCGAALLAIGKLLLFLGALPDRAPKRPPAVDGT